MATLVVIGYDSELKAEEVRLALLKMQKQYLIDLADAVVFLARSYDHSEPINVGTGNEVTIGKIAAIGQTGVSGSPASMDQLLGDKLCTS